MSNAPTAADVRRLLGRNWGTWGEFKGKLVKAGIVARFTDPAPVEWIAAWNEFSGRPRNFGRRSASD